VCIQILQEVGGFAIHGQILLVFGVYMHLPTCLPKSLANVSAQGHKGFVAADAVTT